VGYRAIGVELAKSGHVNERGRQGRYPAAPGLAWHGFGVGAVPARISCRDGRYLPSWLFVDREPVRKLKGVVIPAPGARVFIARLLRAGADYPPITPAPSGRDAKASQGSRLTPTTRTNPSGNCV